MKLITFYADCKLPEGPKANQDGFDWRRAIKHLEKSAAKFGYQTVVVTDEKTDIDAWLRVGDAAEGLMMWLLKAQGHAIGEFKGEKAVMVSPDTLIAGPLDFLFGRWDLTLFTRRRPKPIVNSVIAFKPSIGLTALWANIVKIADDLPPESKEWGADIDAVVKACRVAPMEDCHRRVGNVDVRLLPTYARFESVKSDGEVKRLNVPIWDFKGPRKKLMPAYARMLGC